MRIFLLIGILCALTFIPFISVSASEDPCYELMGPQCDDNYSINGYWWFGYWVPGLISFETQLMPTPPVVMGTATFYAPEVMEATANIRDLSLDGYIGGVSTLVAGNIGMKVWLKRPDSVWEGPFLVVDCSRRNDIYGHVNYMGLAVEVDFDTAVRWGMARYGGPDNDGRWTAIKPRIDNVIVSKYPPEYVNSNKIVPIESWFNSAATFAKNLGGYLLYEGNFEWILNFTDRIVFSQPIPIYPKPKFTID